MSRAKAYFFASGYQSCNYVRCYLPQLHCGFRGTQGSIHGETKPRKQIADEVNMADIAVFHRPDSPAVHRMAMAIRNAGKIIVFDNDDTASLDKTHPFHSVDSMGNKKNAEAYKNVINNFVFNADAVTTTTEFLANEYRELNKNVAVLPNCVDPDDWDEPLRNETNKVRVMISGSASYTQDFIHIADYLRELDARDDVQLVLFGLWTGRKREENPLIEKTYEEEYKFWDSLPNLEHIGWVQPQYYPQALNEARADIMIIPRKENYFNRCKSNIKFLEAAMCEIPVVAQSFSTGDSPYDLDSEALQLATDMLDWKKKVDNLIENKMLRRELGRKAREHVVENYDIAKKAHLWESFYDSLLLLKEKNGES